MLRVYCLTCLWIYIFHSSNYVLHVLLFSICLNPSPHLWVSKVVIGVICSRKYIKKWYMLTPKMCYKPFIKCSRLFPIRLKCKGQIKYNLNISSDIQTTMCFCNYIIFCSISLYTDFFVDFSRCCPPHFLFFMWPLPHTFNPKLRSFKSLIFNCV